MSGAPPAARIGPTLLAAQLVFSVGFYAVVPFLAVHLRDDLGVAAGGVAIALALRTFGQQGLFVVGGALADRYGPGVVILAGVGVRVAGYLGLALAAGYPAVVAAAFVTGVGGALFSPAMQSLLAASADARRATVFGRLAVAGELGAVAGPVLGAALLGAGFRTVAVAGAALFTLVGLVLLLVLRPVRTRPAGGSKPPQSDPAGPDRPPAEPSRPSWRRALADGPFVRYSLACGTFLLAYNQLYIAVPVLASTAVGPAAAAGLTAVAFVVASVLIVAGQLPVVRLTARVPDRWLLPAGFLLVAAGFAAVAGALTLRGPAADPVLPVLALVVLLTLGQLLIGPRSLDLVARFAQGGPTGAYYGLFTTAGGVLTLAGSVPVGLLLDASPAAAWWLLAATGALAALALAGLLRRVPVPLPTALIPDPDPESRSPARSIE